MMLSENINLFACDDFIFYLCPVCINGNRLCWGATCQGYYRCSTKMSIFKFNGLYEQPIDIFWELYA